MPGRTIPRILALLLVGLFLLLLLASSALIFSGFIQVEQKQTEKVLSRAQTAYQNELTELNTKASDWGDWDDSWNFTCGTEPSFPGINLIDSSYADLEISTILYVNDGDPGVQSQGCPETGPVRVLDPAKQIVYPYNPDVPSTEIPADLRQALSQGSPVLTHHAVSSPDHLTYYQTGLINLKEGPFLYVARPIVHSDGSGPLVGTIIFGRYIDSTELQKIAGLTHLVTASGKPTISFTSLSGGQIPADVAGAAKKLEAGKSQVVSALSSNTIAAYGLIKDYKGKPALVLRIETPRPIYSQALKSIFYFDIALVAIGLIFGSITLLLMQRSVIDPIRKLSENVSAAANTKNYSLRIPVQGKDELSKIAESLDKIFDELEASVQLRHELQQLQQLEASQTRPQPVISTAEQTAPEVGPLPTQPSPPPPPPSVDNWTEGGER